MEDIGTLFSSLATGMPWLLFHFLVTLLLLGVGVLIYQRITPFDEMALIRENNVAAAATALGSLLGMGIPLAATLAVNVFVAYIILWGIVAVALQLLTYVGASYLMKGLHGEIERGNLAYGLLLMGLQVTIGLVNAAAMVG